ncbi:YsaB family lipoprotein [Kosakonia radicincitans]|uniref:YsaB family lipoprotein n=1 Tax=Kosakonia radicincitans TaxID=283686 RepID=UPI0005C2E4C1|nr:YsaB family lipoprotein [Kosakonia radicincitans]KIS42056.1 ysaB-like lipofamily protein [Kosakonia radicincitans YD4]
MMKSLIPMLLLLVAGCSATSGTPVQRAQNARPDPVRSLDMEQLCRQNAAHRYNTAAQKIAVTGFEQFRGSYEMRGMTPRSEAFVCTFDAEGQFLHLSMR